ncbi:MAG: sulfatase-like hydrolase/transferase [Pirellulaceae bacterium]
MNKRILPARTLAILALVTNCSVMIYSGTSAAAPPRRPNILWLSCEDISSHLGCYGYERATTPNLDRFAQQGVLFQNAFATAGVCAPCRSAIITGMYQSSLGTQHMRCSASLPSHIKPFPTYLRSGGYYCTNNSKQDYQFKAPRGTWDESSGKAHWKNRTSDNQPFFAVFNYTGCHESGIASSAKYEKVVEGLERHNRDDVAASLPPYYPDTEGVRDDWGRYYDVITAMDRWVGEHLQALEDAGLSDDTIVVFWSDHGVGLPRAKRWLYDSGMQVPLIVRVPSRWQDVAPGKPGTTTTKLVSLIDLGPTALALAGVAVPEHMHGRPFFGSSDIEPRDYVYGARDRMDERYDIIRAVRDTRFKYIRNYEPYKTFYQFMNTPEKGRTMAEIRRVQKDGSASEGVAKFLTSGKSTEELYDAQSDPHEMNNLANDPKYRQVVKKMRQVHLDWVLRTRDLGLIPEAQIHTEATERGLTPHDLLAGDDGAARTGRIRMAASRSLAGEDEAASIIQLLDDSDPVVRYWGAIGCGNLPNATKTAIPKLRALLKDDSENVRIAAARALCHLGKSAEALPTLVGVLDNGSQWARVHAANVADEIDELARPIVPDLQRNLAYRKEFVADGKYTVRVLNRALNELLGTDRQVK